MIWRSSYHSRIAQFIDFVVVCLSFSSAYFLATLLHNLKPEFFPPNPAVRTSYILVTLLLSVLYVILLSEQKAYSYQRFTSLFIEYKILLRVCFIGLLLSITITFLVGLRETPRTLFILYFFTSFIFLTIEKTLLFYVASYIRGKGRNRRRVLVIGTGERAYNFIQTVKHNFNWGLDIIGVLTTDEKMIGENFLGYNVIDSYKNTKKILKELNPEEVIVTISTRYFDQIRDIFEDCETLGVNIRLNSDFFGHLTKNVQLDNVFGLNLISFYPTKHSEFELVLKRFLDVVVSLILIILLAPFLIVIALAIYIQDGGPVIYRWEIVGQDRRPIVSWKFRTMVKNADELKKKLLELNEMTGPMFKLTNDPRILPVGRFLRKFSLDELPQLFSVLKGDLSLVGPRPPLRYEFKEFDLWHRRKLSVKPGLTCLWQISGRNRINNFDDWARLDLEYIDNWSLWLDIKILFKTIPAVISGRGAK